MDLFVPPKGSMNEEPTNWVKPMKFKIIKFDGDEEPFLWDCFRKVNALVFNH